MLTWSFACTGRPSVRVARVAITSFAFMLLDVPEPVWNTSTGNWPSRSPAATCFAAEANAALGHLPADVAAAIGSAAAALISPSARRNPRGMGSPEMGKFCTARQVCAP